MVMKKLLAVILVLALFGGLLSACSNNELATANTKIVQLEKDLAAAKVYDAANFLKWFEETGTNRSVSLDNATPGTPTAFIADASGAPTDEKLKTILHFSSLAVSSGGKNDWFLVAVKDPAEQLAIIGKTDKGVSKCTSAGTVTVLVFSERILLPKFRTDKEGDPSFAAFQPDRGYYDAGIITGYLQTAAIGLGYGTHMFQTPAIPGVNGFNDGGPGLDTKKYLTGTKYTNAATKGLYSNDNMKFVCAIVIGTLDKKHTAGVTDKIRPDNWSIWTK
jgi:hypothetical protein